ncbi:MAG: aminoacyl-histidine dipeptidase [Clostridia bacterium]|nr:aminoacyl-histidine dipeptidase [Clostridia bacterium]
MNKLFCGYEPARLFEYFYEISQIPHGSGNEKGVADYLVSFAEKQGLEWYRDEYHNVAIYRPASAGMEDREPVLLQAHTDMVCEKIAGVEHDFLKDGLKLNVRDGWLSAEGTTLGGDDGAGVCLILALLADKDLRAPALECLFTVQEETGLGGASLFDYSRLTARRVINLDSEEEGVATASCAGSYNLSFTLDPEWIGNENKCMKISVSGLAGGHSGGDIHLGRMNALLLLGRILSELYEKYPFNLVSFEGGSKRNAIPREAEAVISVFERDAALEEVKRITARVRQVLVKEDRKLKVRASKAARADRVMTFKDTSKLLSLLSLVPNGVLSMSASKPGLVESSSNLGVARMTDGRIDLSVYARSSVETETDYIEVRMRRLAKVTGFGYVFCDRSPGWAFDPSSKLQKDYCAAFRAVFPDGPEPRVEAIHAGLECGIILEKMGGGDAISIGPDMKDIHTPSERLDLHSVERTYVLLKALLSV